MFVVAGYQALSAYNLGATAVGIGIFDGVHRGHQTLLQKVVRLAQQHGLISVAYTFEPHPAEIFQADLAPLLIEPLAVRLERLAAQGIHCTLVQPFDHDFARNTAQDYMQNILVGALQARHIIVGAGFVFGRKQQGDVRLLQSMGQNLGVQIHPIPHVRVDGIEVSSTKIRAFVQAGQVRGARILLQRPFMLTGRVVSGAKRGGSLLGFPTANMQADNALLPSPGVYAARACGVFGQQNAVLNVGYNPTFGQQTVLKIEAHLPDYRGADFYDTSFTLHLIDRIRDEMRFSGIKALISQIHNDIAAARSILESVT